LEGKPCTKADHSGIWINNPFEPLTNVSKNVSLEETEKFRFEVRNAAWLLEQSREEKDEKTWGLLGLFKANRNVIKPQMFFKSRLVDVSDLFKGEEPPHPIKFKNEATKSHVSSIRSATKKEIQKLEMKFKRR
jgi:hypothetical protein